MKNTNKKFLLQNQKVATFGFFFFILLCGGIRAWIWEGKREIIDVIPVVVEYFQGIVFVFVLIKYLIALIFVFTEQKEKKNVCDPSNL